MEKQHRKGQENDLLIHPGGICLCRKTGAAQQLSYFNPSLSLGLKSRD